MKTEYIIIYELAKLMLNKVLWKLCYGGQIFSRLQQGLNLMFKLESNHERKTSKWYARGLIPYWIGNMFDKAYRHYYCMSRLCPSQNYILLKSKHLWVSPLLSHNVSEYLYYIKYRIRQWYTNVKLQTRV